MDIHIFTQEYEIVKDGVIVAEANDRISFKFADLTFNLEIKDSKDDEKTWTDDLHLSEDKKTITLPIRINWNYLATNFSDRIRLASYEEGGKNKQLYLTYTTNGLKGETTKIYVFKYTLFSKDLSK